MIGVDLFFILLLLCVSKIFPTWCVFCASSLASALHLPGPLGFILQSIEDIYDPTHPNFILEPIPGAGGMDMTGADVTEGLAPAITMSFLVPGIGLGLIKGIMLGTLLEMLLLLS